MSEPLAKRFGDRLADVLIVGLLGCLGTLPLVTAAAAWGASISVLRSHRTLDPLRPTGGTVPTWWSLFRQSLRTTKRLSLILIAAVAVGAVDLLFAATQMTALRYPTLVVGVVLLLLVATTAPHVVARSATGTQTMRRLLLDGIGLAAAAPLRSLLLVVLTGVAAIATVAFPPIAPLSLGLLALLAASAHDAALRAARARQQAHA